MISKTLSFILNDLNAYLGTLYTGPNLASLTRLSAKTWDNDDSVDPDERHIYVNLINVEEDKTFKNHLNPVPNSFSGTGSGAVPQVHPMGGIPTMRVTLYVLFAFNSTTYSQSLQLLSDVMTYYLGNPVLTVSIPNVPEFNLEINYHNVSLEDSNNMWSNLGGEQQPYAIYQIKLLEIHPKIDINAIGVPEIQEISPTVTHK